MALDSSPLPFPPEAVWIGSDHPFDLHEAYLCFRSPAGWRPAQIPQQADLYLTADSRYKLWVNGRFVARGPARCYPQAQAVDCVSITGYLQPGRNLIAVQVYQPGYSHFSYVHRGAAGLLVCLICDGQVSLVTNDRWRTRRDWSFSANVLRVSIYGSGVEDRDLGQMDRWLQPGYDDSSWSSPRVVAPADGPLWTGLRLRDVPFPIERESPLSLLKTRTGRYPTEHQADPHLALREGWFAAEPTPILADDQSWFTPNLVDSEAAYWLFDLGRDYTCQGVVEVEGAAGQEVLSLSYQEKIRGGELVISDPQTYCRVRLTDRFRLRSGSQLVESFSFRGGRYLLWQLVGPTGPSCRLRFRARVAEYPLEITRPLSTTDEALTAIIGMCEQTLHACLQDGFVDCVWRESSQWLGDALPQSLSLAAMNDDVRPLRQVIEMAAQGAYDDGVLPGVLPGEVHAYTVVDYNFTWVELLRLYWQLQGDDGLVSELWPVLQKMLDRFHQDLNEDGLIISQPGRRLFLDWSPLSRSEPSAVYNLRYLLALQQAAHLAGEREATTGEDALWRERAVRLQSAIRAAFWHQERWYDDVEQTTFSQQAAALALLTESTPAEALAAQLEAIAARSLDSSDEPALAKMVLASPFMHHYVFEALRRHQKFEAVIEIIRRRWGRWAAAGYPTTWENWSVDFPDGSQCHAFSAHPRYHLAQIQQAGGQF